MRILIDWEIKVSFQDGLVYLTEGAARYCGSEIELCLPLNFKQAKKIIDKTASDCKLRQEVISASKKFQMYHREVSFRKMHTLSDRTQDVWRMVLTDENGMFPEEPDCNPIYKKQLDETRALS